MKKMFDFKKVNGADILNLNVNNRLVLGKSSVYIQEKQIDKWINLKRIRNPKFSVE